MGNKSLKCIIALLIQLSAKSLLADSPLTSTYIANFYYDHAIVSTAESTHGLNQEIMAFLADEHTLIDVKAAVINAIGWSYAGNANASQFWQYLADKHGSTAEKLNLKDLNAHELFSYGYLMALGDYFNVEAAITVLELAAQKQTASFTIHLFLAVTKAQKAMNNDWCQVWQLTSAVLNDTSLKRDLKTAAIQSVVDYMILYKSSCAEADRASGGRR